MTDNIVGPYHGRDWNARFLYSSEVLQVLVRIEFSWKIMFLKTVKRDINFVVHGDVRRYFSEKSFRQINKLPLHS